jgi:hypothetical protein
MSDDPTNQITQPEPPEEVDELSDDELDDTLEDASPVEDDATVPTTEDPTP